LRFYKFRIRFFKRWSTFLSVCWSLRFLLDRSPF